VVAATAGWVAGATAAGLGTLGDELLETPSGVVGVASATLLSAGAGCSVLEETVIPGMPPPK
jgi:hypothetical protein